MGTYLYDDGTPPPPTTTTTATKLLRGIFTTIMKVIRLKLAGKCGACSLMGYDHNSGKPGRLEDPDNLRNG
jgi:hypothetical protein